MASEGLSNRAAHIYWIMGELGYIEQDVDVNFLAYLLLCPVGAINRALVELVARGYVAINFSDGSNITHDERIASVVVKRPGKPPHAIPD